MKTVSPDGAVISVGRDNPFGHPHEEMLSLLQGILIFRTDSDGAVKIQNSPNGLVFRTYREFKFKHVSSLKDELKNIERLFEIW
jgi:competence protein ComEC